MVFKIPIWYFLANFVVADQKYTSYLICGVVVIKSLKDWSVLAAVKQVML